MSELKLSRFQYACLLAFIPAAIFLYYFSTGRFVYSHDTLNLFYVGKRWFWTEVLNGHLPLWNENLFGGFDFFASPANGLTSPISALFYLSFPSILAEELQLPLFAVIAAVGMYLWLKRLSGSPEASLLGGLAYALSGPLLSLADRSHIFFSVCLYPWAFLAFEWIVEGRAGAIGLFSAVIAMMIIHADWVAVLIAILCVGYMAFLRDRKIFPSLMLGTLWAFGLAALALLPVVLNVGETTRASGFTFEQVSYYSLHPLRLFNLLSPEAWGQAYDYSFYGQAVANAYKGERFWYHSIYLGVPVLVLALGGLLSLRRLRHGLPALALAAGFLLLAFGNHFVLHELLFKYLPGYKSLRFPEKFVLYSIFAAYPLAAITAARITRWRNWLLAMACAELVAFVWPLFWPALADHMTYTQYVAHALFAVLFIAGAIKRPAQILLLLTAITVADLWLFSPPYLTISLDAASESSPFTEALRGNRFVRDDNLSEFRNEHPARGLEPNWPMLNNLREVFGYESITPLRSEALVGKEVFENLEAWAPVLNFTHVVSVSQKTSELKQVFEKGLIEPVAADQETNSVLLAIHRKNREFSLLCNSTVVDGPDAAFARVRERKGVLEPVIVEQRKDVPVPASTTNCGPSDIERTESSSERHLYKVRASAPMWLVEREAFNANWRVSIDGQAAPLWHVDFASRGILLPAGEHLVEVRFEPRILFFSAWISLLSMLALLLYFVIWAKRTIPQLSRST